MLGTSSRISRRRCPGIFVQKAQRSVERRAAPHFQAEEIRQTLRDGARGREKSYVRTRVAISDWCASRNVVSVISRRFSLRAHAANFFGPSFCSICRVPAGGSMPSVLRQHGGFELAGDDLPFYLGIAVEDHIAEIRKQFGGAIAAASETGIVPANDRETTS